MEEGELVEEQGHEEKAVENSAWETHAGEANDEQGYEEGEDDELYPSDPELQPRALPVMIGEGDEENDANGAPPRSGEEYLRRVAMEARRLPRVVLASQLPPPPTAPNIVLISIPANAQLYGALNREQDDHQAYILPGLNASRQANEAWRTAVLHSFRALRKRLANAPQGSAGLGDELAWRNKAYGARAAAPVLSELLKLGPSAVASLLRAHVRWLKREEMSHTADPDTSASLRALLRFCRSSLASSLGSAASTSDATLHLLAAIAAHYYNQQAPDE